jgi:hypothetical protein
VTVRSAAGGALITVVLTAGAACSDDSTVTVGTEVGEVTIEVRDDLLCLDGGAKGGFCGDRPDDTTPVVWGTSTGGGPDSPTYVWGVASPDVTRFDVVVAGEDPVTPELHAVDGGVADGMSVWAIQLGPQGDPLAADASEIAIENVEKT